MSDETVLRKKSAPPGKITSVVPHFDQKADTVAEVGYAGLGDPLYPAYTWSDVRKT
jgi:hypothetical protein